MQQMVNVGKIISELLDKNNMTQRELASKINVTEVTISRYINGTREPKGSILMDIANALNVTTDYLLGNNPVEASYYINEDTAELAQEIFENPDLKILLSASRKLKKEDLETLIKLVDSMKKE